MQELSLRVFDRISDIPESDWQALWSQDATPFMKWRFLEALEVGEAVGGPVRWWPRHLTVWRGERLVAAAPAYVKVDSAGDFSRDWGWVHLARQVGSSFYPKLVITVPFTPVPGRRILVAADEDRETLISAIITLAVRQAEAEEVRSVHVLFCTPDESAILEEVGLAPRVLYQYHWHNRDYANADEWLAVFNSKRRNQIRREKREPGKQGIELRTVRGDEIAGSSRKWSRDAYGLYRTTCDKFMWGRPYLTKAFYRRLFKQMPEHVELVEARLSGRLVAGAINISSDTRLYGRYWGCHEEHRFLHFNVCLYHSIDDCIARGLQVFEGGMGGDHKLSRGFEPVLVHSAHHFLDPQLDALIGRYCALEKASRVEELATWQKEQDRRSAP